MGKVIGRIDYNERDFERGFELAVGKRMDHFIKYFGQHFSLNLDAVKTTLVNLLENGYTIRVLPDNRFKLRVTERQCGATMTITFNPVVDIDLDAPLYKRSWLNKFPNGNIKREDFYHGSVAKLFTKAIDSFVTTGKLYYHIGNGHRVFLLGDRDHSDILFTV